jgi:hypothetical protein
LKSYLEVSEDIEPHEIVDLLLSTADILTAVEDKAED